MAKTKMKITASKVQQNNPIAGVIAVILGSIIYRFIYAVVFYTKIVPVECLKLLTAVIVGLAIAAPTLKKWVQFQRRKAAARKEAKV